MVAWFLLCAGEMLVNCYIYRSLDLLITKTKTRRDCGGFPSVAATLCFKRAWLGAVTRSICLCFRHVVIAAACVLVHILSAQNSTGNPFPRNRDRLVSLQRGWQRWRTRRHGKAWWMVSDDPATPGCSVTASGGVSSGRGSSNSNIPRGWPTGTFYVRAGLVGAVWYLSLARRCQEPPAWTRPEG